MANTPTYAWPTPELSEPGNIPVDTSELANAIEGTVRKLDPAISGGAVPVGALMMWMLAAAPTGWLLCDGAPIPGQYLTLISLIGANTPNLQGRVPVGAGTAAGDPTATAKMLNGAGGAEKVGLTVAQLPAHHHATNFDFGPIGLVFGPAQVSVPQGGTRQSLDTGSNETHENLPPYLTVNYIIRAG